MVTNKSNSTKTINEYILQKNIDIWSLDRLTKYINYKNQIYVPNYTLLDKYYSFFENVLIDVPLESKYYYSPTLFSEDYYGTPDLAFLILYFSKTFSLFNFNKPVIKMLPQSYLNEINKLMINSEKEISENRNNTPVYNEMTPIRNIDKVFDSTAYKYIGSYSYLKDQIQKLNFNDLKSYNNKQN
jgi:hypothetical protein